MRSTTQGPYRKGAASLLSGFRDNIHRPLRAIFGITLAGGQPFRLILIDDCARLENTTPVR
jgi:hypothetical protein